MASGCEDGTICVYRLPPGTCYGHQPPTPTRRRPMSRRWPSRRTARCWPQRAWIKPSRSGQPVIGPSSKRSPDIPMVLPRLLSVQTDRRLSQAAWMERSRFGIRAATVSATIAAHALPVTATIFSTDGSLVISGERRRHGPPLVGCRRIRRWRAGRPKLFHRGGGHFSRWNPVRQRRRR